MKLGKRNGALQVALTNKLYIIQPILRILKIHKELKIDTETNQQQPLNYFVILRDLGFILKHFFQ